MSSTINCHFETVVIILNKGGFIPKKHLTTHMQTGLNPKTSETQQEFLKSLHIPYN